MKIRIIVTAFLMMVAFLGQAQVSPGDTTEYIIKLGNGNEYVGVIVQDDGREMLIQTKSLGKIYVSKTDVVSITKNDKSHAVVVDGEVWDNSTFSTRYFLTTNGLPIKKGENYYMIHLFGPEFHVAVSNSVNVGIMTTWIGAPFLFTVKKSFATKRPDINLALGSLNGNLSFFNEFKGLFSLNFLSITKGNRENNITLSGGYVHWHNGMKADLYQTNVKANGFLGSVAGSWRISKSASFIFDSMIGYLYSKRNSYEEENTYDANWNVVYVNRFKVEKNTERAFYMFMPGIRVMETKNRAFQFYLNYTNVEDVQFGFPMVSWLRTF
jgi:hypothetical protein